jgi:DNA-binding PadR family transcriptional regulator
MYNKIKHSKHHPDSATRRRFVPEGQEASSQGHRYEEGYHRMRRGGHGHGHGHGRHGLRRFFAHGDLRLVVLHLIGEKPRHGYELIKAIEESVSGAYSPSPGTIYPTLSMLEDQGYVQVSDAGGSKKLYEITPEGRAYLEQNQKPLEELHRQMEKAAEAHRDNDAPQVVRAMENLRLALRLRLSRGPLTETELDKVAAAIDAAAHQVEKS